MGALAAAVLKLPERVAATLTAFGGGLLLAAVALELVPEADRGGVPESAALGLTVAQGELGVALLVGVVVGNVVESYGAAQPILAGGLSRRFAVGLLGGIGAALALATVLGGTVLAEASEELIGRRRPGHSADRSWRAGSGR